MYTKRCKRCVKLGEYIPAGSTEEIEQKVERRVTQQTQQQLDQERAAMQADEAAKQAQQQQWNAEMAKQVSEIQPFAREFGDRWYKKISIGTLVYGDYRFYSHTGFGPQFLTQQVWPGPGNDTFNSFDITRTYLDFKFTPVDDVSLRVTPNMYLMVNTGAKCTATVGGKNICTASSGDPDGLNTGWGQTVDGNLGFRLKYAYIDYNTFFQKVLKVAAIHDDKITFGQQQNPLVDWEENLWGFRYTALTPWNYLSLSSSQVGLSVKGPIKVNEIQYADYDVGVYDDASFHATEQSSSKQVMGRVTVNPLGAHSRYDSLGITGFYDFGYSNKCTPDDNSVKGNNSTCGHTARAAALVHYTADSWGLIGEWDYGHNAFSSGNLYSGSGPSDAIGIASPSRQARRPGLWTLEQDGRRYPEQSGGADGLGFPGSLRYPAHAVYCLWRVAAVSAQHAHREGPARLRALRPGRAVAHQQVSARGVGHAGHPVLPETVHLRRAVWAGGGQEADSCAECGAVRHPRIHVELGVQILVTNRESRREHTKCSRRLVFWRNP